MTMSARGALTLAATTLALAMLSVSATNAIATPPAEPAKDAEADDWGDDGADWEDNAAVQAAISEPTAATAIGGDGASNLSLTGFLRSDWGVWTERFGDGEEPFAKGRQSVDLKADYGSGDLEAIVSIHIEKDLAYDHDRARFDAATLRDYGSLFQLREAFIAYSAGAWEWTFGRQIVAWGEGDAVSPLDVVNPRDMREPGLADLDDLRIPVFASRIGYFVGAHRFEAMAVHEANFGLRTPPRGPFSPLTWMLDNTAEIKGLLALTGASLDAVAFDFSHGQERFAVANQQGLARWVYKGEGIDLGIYAASVLDQQGIIDIGVADKTALSEVLQGKRTEIDLALDHRRYEVFGTSGAWATGSLLVKWEAMFERGHPYNAGTFPDMNVVEANAISGMLGLSYSGIDDTTVALECGKTHLLDKVDGLFFPVDQPVLMLRAMHEAMRGKLRLLAAGSAMGLKAELGWLLRAQATYQPMDAFGATLGYITYQPTEQLGPFAGLTEHDRLFFRLRWDFTAR